MVVVVVVVEVVVVVVVVVVVKVVVRPVADVCPRLQRLKSQDLVFSW